MEAHAHLHGLYVQAAQGPLPSRQVPLHIQSRQHRALRMILLCYGSAKDDQDAIPSYRTDCASISLGDMVCQLKQRMQPALPYLQAALRTLYGRSYQRTTQDSHHFPLIDGERVRYRQ
jgi:hypothetical protein